MDLNIHDFSILSRIKSILSNCDKKGILTTAGHIYSRIGACLQFRSAGHRTCIQGSVLVELSNSDSYVYKVCMCCESDLFKLLRQADSNAYQIIAQCSIRFLHS